MIDEREREWPLPYGELYQRSLQIAAGLRRQGLGTGERVTIMLPTGAEFIASFFGTLLAGGIPVPVSPPTFLDDVTDFLARFEAIAKSCQPAVLITFKDISLLAASAARVCPSIRGVFSSEALSADPEGFVPHQPRAEDTCFLQYTSGSTGMPKGVELTHANVLANADGIGRMIEVNDRDVGVNWLPLYHDMGLIGALLTGIYWGVPLVLLSPQTFIKYPVRWLKAIDRFAGTISLAPNFAYRVCLKIPPEQLTGLDLSRWRVAFNGAEPIDRETIQLFLEKLAPAGVSPRVPFPVYGLAEATLAVTHPDLEAPIELEHVDGDLLCAEGRAVPAPRDQAGATCLVSVGRPLPQTEVAIMSIDGAPLGERSVGEIWVRGPAVMKGYYRAPEASAEALRGGWLATGDLGYLAGGRLFVTGRKKDLLIKAGRNYYPQDVEAAASSLPGVRRGCAVAFGIHDPIRGTEKVVVLAESRRPLDPEAARALEQLIRGTIAAKVGLSVDVVELVPARTILRTSSGKARRNETRALYLAGRHHLARRTGRLSVALTVLRSLWQLVLLRLRPSAAPRHAES
jgi:acyl-CoA synthetase (AMP-forming)/AMP-acid ligase II